MAAIAESPEATTCLRYACGPLTAVLRGMGDDMMKDLIELRAIADCEVNGSCRAKQVLNGTVPLGTFVEQAGDASAEAGGL